MSSIIIAGEITVETYREVAEAVYRQKEYGMDVEIQLNSEGGDTYSARAIASTLRSCGLTTKVEVHGHCFSAATIILASAEHRVMAHSAWWMLHGAVDKFKGQLYDVDREIKQLKAEERQWLRLMEDYCSVPAALFAELSADSKYLSAEDCLKLGIINKII